MDNTYYFDLQLFADEAGDEQMDVAPEAPEDSQPAEPVNEEPRPEELNGLPDDVAKAAIDLAKEQESNVVGEQRADDDSAGQTSVTKNVDGIAQPNQKIPYNRFKQEVDKRHELEEALNAYKAKFGDIDAQHQVPEQPIQQAQPMQEPVPPMPSTAQTPLINPESIKLINEAAQKQAMQMAGLTQDDFYSLTPEQVKRYEALYHDPQLFYPLGDTVFVENCSPERYRQVMNPEENREKTPPPKQTSTPER